MNEPGGEWLSAKALMGQTGVGEVTLARWRSWGLFPKGARTFHGRHKGTGAFLYPSHRRRDNQGLTRPATP